MLDREAGRKELLKKMAEITNALRMRQREFQGLAYSKGH